LITLRSAVVGDNNTEWWQTTSRFKTLAGSG